MLYEVITNPKDFKAETFRTLIQHKLNRNSWGSLGIDVALGSVIDQKATPLEHMFLPSYIHAFFETATFKESNTPLVRESKTVYTEKATRNNFV